MKPNLRALVPPALLAATVFCALAPRARAFEQLGDDAELVFRGTGTVTYNDNLFLLRQNTQSDVMEDLDTELALDWGKKSKTFHGTLTGGEDFEFFDTHSDLDADLGKVGLAANINTEKSGLSLTGSFNQAVQPTATERYVGVNLQEADELIRRNNYGLGGVADYTFSDKTSMDAGLNYTETQYKTTGFANLQYVDVPVDFYYDVLPKLAVSAGFSYRDNWVGVGALGKGLDSQDYFYNVGAKGEFSAKLTGQVKVGYTVDQIHNFGNTNTLGVQANLNYALTTKSTMNLAFTNDYGYNAYGAGFRDLAIALSDNTTLSTQWSVRAAIAYNQYSYTTTAELDNIWALTAAATYNIGKYTSITAAYSFTDDISNLSADGFENNILSLAVAVHF